ncbi:hypothetical protein [Streptomyces sp. NPDC059909]|uniref:hypothetical protein n=1 Tax=Streptomyces sp. NPDC059909 TaxID=3346998 RepID=UPI003650547E
MPYNKGQRVEYRDEQNRMQEGQIQRAEGSGEQTKYAIKNEQTQRVDQVTERQIQRPLQ